MTFPRNSSKYGTVQPPSVKLPLGSSVGPPGPCMTPSRERKVRTIIFLMETILPEVKSHPTFVHMVVSKSRFTSFCTQVSPTDALRAVLSITPMDKLSLLQSSAACLPDSVRRSPRMRICSSRAAWCCSCIAQNLLRIASTVGSFTDCWETGLGSGDTNNARTPFCERPHPHGLLLLLLAVQPRGPCISRR